MDRTAVFIDAGYLFAQGSAALNNGNKLPRGSVTLDIAKAETFLRHLAHELTGLPLLRIYWYDGTSSGPTATHQALAHHANVKVRLGLVNAYGEQKGVDSLVVTDMINLARNRAMADAVLMTGDEDLRVGVQQAQEFGIRVHLVGIVPSRGSQSLLLLQEADQVRELSVTDVAKFLSVRPDRAEVLAALGRAPTRDKALAAAVAAVKASLTPEERDDLAAQFAAGKPVLPKGVDAVLLQALERTLGSPPDENTKREARSAFREAIVPD